MLLLLLGCNNDDEINWVQYNAADNAVTVEVGAAELLDPVEGSLTSSTGQVEIGLGRVEPGGGPIGTEHSVVVEIFDDFDQDVGRVTVQMSSGERGKDEVELSPDSTGEGIWLVEVVSVGDEGETRSDPFTFWFWTEGEVAE